MARDFGVNGSAEISLDELFVYFWAQKWLIISCMLFAAVCAGAFLYFSSPVYEARAGVLPPRLSDIAEYNLGRREASLAEFKIQDVYAVFKRNLTSESLKRELFNKFYLPGLGEGVDGVAQNEMWEGFKEKIDVVTPDIKKNPDYFQVIAVHEDSQLAAELVNRFVSMAAEKTESDMQSNLQAEIGTKIQSLERKIDVAREVAAKRRWDRIVQLREALVVAESVGIDAPQVTAGKISSGGNLAEFVNGSLMYMRGAKAVRAELVLLEKRESDDAFIPELRDLEMKLEFLKLVEVNPDNVSVYNLDSAAEVPRKPVGPKKALILVLGLFLGGVVGLFVSLVFFVVKRR